MGGKMEILIIQMYLKYYNNAIKNHVHRTW